MRLTILSDLHLELWRDHAPRIDVTVNKPDVVVLAGDIHKSGKAVKWAAEVFADIPVMYVSGNHEAYGDTLEGTEKSINEACAQYSNVHYLNCSEVILGDIRFLGCALWTDYCLFGDDRRYSAMLASQHVMNDYQRIRVKTDQYRKLRPADTALIHAKQKSWLKAKLAESFAGKTVVVTHMAPSMKSVAPEYETDLVSASYASNMDELVEQADLWVHGHMHSKFDYQIGKCRVMCNPCGYMNKSGGTENEKFDPNFIVLL